MCQMKTCERWRLKILKGRALIMSALAVTGHRPDKLWGYSYKRPQYIALGKQIRDYILGSGHVHFITGMALGVDTIFALVVLKLKQQYPNTYTLECAIPCRNHSCKWQSESVKLYHEIVCQADTVTLVSDTEYTPHCMQLRNEYMVDHCDELLAVWDGSSGGTGNCVQYAKRKSVQIHQINPTAL